MDGTWVIGSPAASRHPARTLAIAVIGVLSGLVVGSALALVLATQVFGFEVITVRSNSMEPALDAGDVMFTRPVAIEDVEVGDVILFDQGKRTIIPVAHRVVGIINLRTNITDSETGETTSRTSKLLRTMGDANPAPDQQLVDRSRLRGSLWLTVPGAGRLFGDLGLRRGLLLVAAVIALAWGAFEIVRSRRRAGRTHGSGG
jgi:signal peptidase